MDGAVMRPKPCRLLVGSTHNDALLVHEGLVLELFPSPLTFKCTALLPSGMLALTLHPELILELNSDM